MYDLLTLLQGKAELAYSGIYFEKLPTTPDVVGERFDYQIITAEEKHYQMLTGNISASENLSIYIKTNDPLNWRINGYILLQDNTLYTIETCQGDYAMASKPSARYVREILGKEYFMRLIQVENTLGIHI